MSRASAAALDQALAALGDSPLDEAAVARHIAPLFSRALARPRSYLANHSLGRPLDAMEDDVREALAAWYADHGGAWRRWEEEGRAHRARLARLLGASRPDAVVPKTSAAQGLRAVLNGYDVAPRVVSTRGEFDSLDLVLREYARRGRIRLALVEPRADGTFANADLHAALAPGADLLVVSEAMFQTGQLLPDLAGLVAAAHAKGARVLVDVYHSLGVVPVDVASLDIDFAVGGCYKYLRGGPGACFLYVAPRLLDAGLTTPDTGWFAKESPFDYARPDPPRLAAGGDAWLESTPPVLTWFQARSGLAFTLGVGVARLRDWSLRQQARLVALLAAEGIGALGGSPDRGAFVAIRHDGAAALASALAARGIDVDARGPWLRICPDLLTRDEELVRAARELGSAWRARP